MARPKGGKNRKWTNEERLKYVLMCEEEHIPVRTIVREEGISRGTLREWIRRYRSGGEEALNPEKLHPGNHFSALHTSKSLSNERLKKGYTVKGVGADKEFVTTKDLNSK